MYPKTYKKLVASKLSKNFRTAVEIVAVDWIFPSSNEVVIRNLFAGVNASDVNITAGVYFVNTPPPFALGVEAAGEVVAIGSNVLHLQV